MAKRRELVLKPRQVRELEDHRDHDERPYVRERCGALLKIAAGEAPYHVARTGVLKPRDPDTVYAWLAAYEQEGMDGVLGHQQGGPHRERLRGARHAERDHPGAVAAGPGGSGP